MTKVLITDNRERVFHPTSKNRGKVYLAGCKFYGTKQGATFKPDCGRRFRAALSAMKY